MDENTRTILEVEDASEDKSKVDNFLKKVKADSTATAFWIVVGILVCAFIVFVIRDNTKTKPEVPYLTHDVMYQAMSESEYDLSDNEILALLDWMKLASDDTYGYNINVEVAGGTNMMFDRWNISLTNPYETIKMSFFYGSLSEKWKLTNLQWDLRRYYSTMMQEKLV